MGNARSGDGRGGMKRRSLRDTSLRFQRRDDDVYRGTTGNNKSDGRSKSVSVATFSQLIGAQKEQSATDNLLLVGAGLAAAKNRRGSWFGGMN